MQINNQFLKVAYEEFQIRLKEVRDYIDFVNKLDSSYIGEGLVIDKDEILIDLNLLKANLHLVGTGSEEDSEEPIILSDLYEATIQLEEKLEDKESELATINRDLLKTLRASSYLLLYNLLESTMCEAINAIHETIDSKNIEITNLSEKIHKIILTSFQKGLTNEKISQYSRDNIDIRNSLMDLGYNKRKLFSGNIDADLIEKYCKNYGFRPHEYKDNSGKRYIYSKDTLKEVKWKRNSLAHGTESFVNCGQSIIIGSLTEKLEHTEAILLAVFNGLNTFLEKENYLRSS